MSDPAYVADPMPVWTTIVLPDWIRTMTKCESQGHDWYYDHPRMAQVCCRCGKVEYGRWGTAR